MGDRRRGGDVGADQEAAGGFDRDLDQDRDVLKRLVAGALGAVDRGLDLKRILASLDDDRVDPTGDQTGALDGQRVFKLLVADMAERGQAGPRSDRAQHKAGAAVMHEFGNRFARDLGRQPVQRKRALGKAKLAQGDRRSAKAVGLDRVAAGDEIAAMDFADEVGAALANDLGAVLQPEKVALDI